jgi:hypothetical protein
MLFRSLFVAVSVSFAVGASRADVTSYRYEGDVLPYDPSAGWEVFNPCEPPCAESVEDGHFVIRWPEIGDFFQHTYFMADAPGQLPSSLWVEWRFASNHPIGPNFTSCDARFTVTYERINDAINMYGNAALSFSGNFWIDNLALTEFHTYRFESANGADFSFSVNGQRFYSDRGDQTPAGPQIIYMVGFGGCGSDQVANAINEWDFVRYGSLTAGELLASSDPLEGYLDPAVYGNLDRFTVTFDQAAYVYIDDVTVEVTGGVAPAVIATQRRENTEPDTVEIVLDRPLPMNETTTFTFDTGGGARQENVVEYRLGVGPVPATSGLALATMIAAILAAGILLARRAAGLRAD